jgi:hypothetical protein
MAKHACGMVRNGQEWSGILPEAFTVTGFWKYGQTDETPRK